MIRSLIEIYRFNFVQLRSSTKNNNFMKSIFFFRSNFSQFINQYDRMKCLSNFFNLLNKSKYTFSIVTNYLTNIYRTIIWIQSRSNWELLVSSTSLCQSLYYVTGKYRWIASYLIFATLKNNGKKKERVGSILRSLLLLIITGKGVGKHNRGRDFLQFARRQRRRRQRAVNREKRVFALARNCEITVFVDFAVGNRVLLLLRARRQPAKSFVTLV